MIGAQMKFRVNEQQANKWGCQIKRNPKKFGFEEEEKEKKLVEDIRSRKIFGFISILKGGRDLCIC